MGADNLRDKESVAVLLDGPEKMGLITVWDTGEIEIEIGDVKTGNVYRQHRDVGDFEGLFNAFRYVIGEVNYDSGNADEDAPEGGV